MDLNKIFTMLISEQGVPKGRKTTPLVKAITDRHPITFYYSGPKSPEKESVKSGVRLRAEAVAMGLSKGGNVIIRAYVQPPSTSKKGFKEHGWRTFIVSRMSNIQILEDETFDNKRPGYKEGEESKRGPMITTYVTSNWGEKPDVERPEEPTAEPTPQVQPSVEPKKEKLPQPKPQETPPPTPEVQPKDRSSEVFGNIQQNVKDVNGVKTITTQDYQNAVNSLYKLKQSDWVNSQKQIGGNTNPGSGTRRKFEMLSNSEISNLLSKNNITVSDNIEEPIEPQSEPLQETLKRIKSLMLLIN